MSDASRCRDLPDELWTSAAACAVIPRRIFQEAETVDEARTACGQCPVQLTCLQWAVEADIDDQEIWGGRTRRERRRLGNVDRNNPPPLLGTHLARPTQPAAVTASHPTQPAQPPPTTPRNAMAAPSSTSAPAAKCGTEAGYRRHLRHGEPACADCLVALKLVRVEREARRASGQVPTRPAIAPCGTPSAYRRHLRRGETPDKACAMAAAAYMRTYRTAAS